MCVLIFTIHSFVHTEEDVFMGTIFFILMGARNNKSINEVF